MEQLVKRGFADEENRWRGGLGNSNPVTKYGGKMGDLEAAWD